MKSFIVGITGASGSVYGASLIEEMYSLGYTVHIVATDQGEQVWKFELESSLATWVRQFPEERVTLHNQQNLFAPIASGSYRVDGMVVVPCSMGTLGKIANGVGGGLLTRCADVCIKERRPLVLVTRETPLSGIHLKNMLTVTQQGAVVFPPVPAFYHKPKSIEDIVTHTVGRVLSTLGVESSKYVSWEGSNGTE